MTSFYGSHVINGAGNGGIVCKFKELFTRIKVARSWGRNSTIIRKREKIENRFNIKVGKVFT